MNAFSSAQFGDRHFFPHSFQHDPYFFFREFRRISRTVDSTPGLISSVISNSFVFPIMIGNHTLAFCSNLSHYS
jgi:hypothetical protein